MTKASMRLRLVLAAVFLTAQAGLAGAVCQIPLAIGQNTGNANVLLLLDNSGSMNEALQSSAYNKNTNYSSGSKKFDRTTSYDITTSGYYTPRSLSGNNSWASTPSVYLVASDQGEAGVYYGNYLNWLFYNATAAQRAAAPTVTRIQAAKSTVNTFLNQITDCRLGLMEFNPNTRIDGGVVLANIGSSVGSIQSIVNSTHAQTMTPLGETMITGLNYFATTGSSAPIQAPCQKSFIVIVTDGLPTADSSFPSYIRDTNRDGYYLDDVATYMYRNDLRPDMDGIQNVATFTIGFNVDNGSLLQRTADNGGGEYYSISDASGLALALTQSFNVIAARVAAGAAVSVVSSEDRSNNRLFRARYESQTWRGFLESFTLPYHAGSSPEWDAGALLRARSASTRTIYTSTNGTSLTAFTTTNASTLRPFLGAADVAAATNIITYVRGDSTPNSRSRNGWKLGDIVDAAPVMVGKPNSYYEMAGYATYRAAQASRQEVLYVAANDGMLHCFSVADGSELWAYIPKDQLPNLYTLMDPAYCHQYFLNMTPAAYDVYLGGSWKTILVGGEGQGGNGLFALDVTNPSSPSLLWEVSPTALKGAYAPPTLVRDRTLNRQVFAIGTGYDASSAQTNLLVIDPADGSILRTIALGSAVTANKTTKATAFDTNFDGYDDLLYLGDLAGRIWRVNLTGSTWSVTNLFLGTQPIQAAPTVTTDNLGRPMIFFGTGKFMTSGDASTTSQQTIYGIVDKSNGVTLRPDSLRNQTSTFATLTSTSNGWYVNLSNSGERVTRNPTLIAGTLFVPTFAPTAAACTGGGQSWLYSLDYKDGSAPDHANGSPNNTTADRSESMGDGILADPTVDLVNQQLILQSSNAVLLAVDISAGLRKLMVRSWRQTWN
ncbi:MAG: PilC/PilY family type IV pilus protein [Candidatus Eisenbacteria bacterium]